MPVQLSMTFTSNRVAPRTLNRIKREINQRTGKDIVQYILPVKFKREAYSEYPGIVRPRQAKYAKSKRAKVGHDIPNVLTGRLRESLKANGDGYRATATANGGRLIIRFYWAAAGRINPKTGKVIKTGARESQRQEMEAVSPKQRDMLARRQAEQFAEAIRDPKNISNRMIRKSRLG